MWLGRRVSSPVMLFALLMITLPLAAWSCSGASTASSEFPTPGAQRTTFTNRAFGYTIAYPTEWQPLALDSGATLKVYVVLSAAYPDAVAFEVRCATLTHAVDAQTQWQQTGPSSRDETAVGARTLSSGASAFVAEGHGQGTYYVYTLTSEKRACQIYEYDVGKNLAPVTSESVNSFRWA
jgi:hypothetical protein